MLRLLRIPDIWYSLWVHSSGNPNTSVPSLSIMLLLLKAKFCLYACQLFCLGWDIYRWQWGFSELLCLKDPQNPLELLKNTWNTCRVKVYMQSHWFICLSVTGVFHCTFPHESLLLPVFNFCLLKWVLKWHFLIQHWIQNRIEHNIGCVLLCSESMKCSWSISLIHPKTFVEMRGCLII